MVGKFYLRISFCLFFEGFFPPLGASFITGQRKHLTHLSTSRCGSEPNRKQQPKSMMGCLKGVVLCSFSCKCVMAVAGKTGPFNSSLSHVIPTADVNVLLKGVLAVDCVLVGVGGGGRGVLIWPAQASTFTTLVYFSLARSLQSSSFCFLICIKEMYIAANVRSDLFALVFIFVGGEMKTTQTTRQV